MTQKFQVIYVDLPLQYLSRVTHGEGNRTKFGGGAERHYPCMLDEEIYSIAPQVRALAEKNAVLLVWTASPKIEVCLQFVRACGFRVATKLFSWFKVNKDGTASISPGSYSASNTEDVYAALPDLADDSDSEFDCWIGARGGGMSPGKFGGKQMVNQVITARKAEHSAKPLEAYEKIEAIWPGASYIELFARNTRPGWTSLGNEIDGRDIREVLYEMTGVRETLAPDGTSWREYASKPYRFDHLREDEFSRYLDAKAAWDDLLSSGLDAREVINALTR